MSSVSKPYNLSWKSRLFLVYFKYILMRDVLLVKKTIKNLANSLNYCNFAADFPKPS